MRNKMFLVLEFFHFACTSEDINNLAHALMLEGAMNNVVIHFMDDLIQALCNMAKDNAHIPRGSCTHGQISSVAIMGKFSGAVGNYNTHLVAYPNINWPQINKDGQVGSSTMPQKINPIDFENSKGNLSVANANLYHPSMKLPISRLQLKRTSVILSSCFCSLQRDLIDLSVLRNMDLGLGHSLLAYKSTLQGISKAQSFRYAARTVYNFAINEGCLLIFFEVKIRYKPKREYTFCTRIYF
ncbi:putative adenylosuccinate lyase [Rosa chinensis]|uniref:Putative adenylosuccinate lyase n=1 Tax=Rosa chinensis TaxID=74649 RepID=A0A2P6QDE4_ROSCH|nr:putative adenylosuccinate lyase [Rosa chinensis]